MTQTRLEQIVERQLAAQRERDEVFRAVVAAVGNSISRFQAAEIADYLLKRTGEDVQKAVEIAKHPSFINGKPNY